jgi:DNA-binding CsgD family transcriptional regulator
LGRVEERARIEEVLDSVVFAPSGVAVEGGPGMGKTTVWRHAVERARGRGYRVLESSPAEPDAALGFAGLGDLFDPLPDEVLALLPDPQRRALAAALLVEEVTDAPSDAQALPRAVLHVLRQLAADGPLVVAIDDEQWLDRASARVLAFALCRLRDERVCVLLARRPHSDGRLWPELARGFRGQGIKTLVLAPLDTGAIDSLVRAQLSGPISRRLLRRIEEVSHGNPLYAVAIARELQAGQPHAGGEHELPIPATLADALAQRLQYVDPRARDPLLVAAAISQPTLAVLQAAIPQFRLSDLESAERTGVIEVAGERVRFTHPLLASTHYAAAPGSRRRELHRRLAEVIDDAEERAYHLGLGAEAADRKIAAALEQAAAAAAKRGAPEVAAELLENAVRLTPLDAAAERWSRTIAAATHHWDSGLLSRARELLEELVPNLPHGPTRARTLRLLALSVTDDLNAAQALLEEALADAADDNGARGAVHQALHIIVGVRGDFAATTEHGRLGVEAAERSGDQGLLAEMLGRHAYSVFFTGRGIQHQEFQRAIELEAHVNATTRHLPTTMLARMLRFSNDYPAARPLLERAVARAREHGEHYDLGWLLLNLAHLEWEAGNHDAAEGHMTEAEDIIGECGDEVDTSYLAHVQSILATERGEIAKARALAEEALRLAQPIGSLIGVAFTTIALAAVELWMGQPAAAHDRLRPARESLLASGLGYMGSPTLDLWSCDIEALLATGQLDEAEQVLADLLARSYASENPHAVAIAHRCQALVLAARGELAGALEAIDTALVEHARRPVPLEMGRTLLEKGALQRRAKRKSAAKRSLEEALVILEPLNAVMWVNRARDELGRVGLRRATVTDGLTPAQARVAELVAAGMSNHEIASTLFMSVRSVEAHLTKVYREYGVRSRSQLAAALAANPGHTTPGRDAAEEQLSTAS